MSEAGREGYGRLQRCNQKTGPSPTTPPHTTPPFQGCIKLQLKQTLHKIFIKYLLRNQRVFFPAAAASPAANQPNYLRRQTQAEFYKQAGFKKVRQQTLS